MSAISSLGLAQSDAGRGGEVLAQTLKETLTGVIVPDADWIKTFCGGNVDLLLVPPKNYRWPTDFGMAVWPTVVDETELKISDTETPIAYTVAAWFKEIGQTREATEPDVSDLVYYLRSALVSQPQLVWKSTWAADPPAGSTIVKGGPGISRNRLRIFTAELDSFYDKGECAVTVTQDAAWALRIEIDC